MKGIYMLAFEINSDMVLIFFLIGVPAIAGLIHVLKGGKVTDAF